MKKLLTLALCLFCWAGMSHADENAFFSYGPLELNVPFKVGRLVYLYDFKAVPGEANKVGGESPFLTLWDKVEGTLGVVTSLAGNGAPFVGGNVLVGNLLEKWVTLPPDFSIGGFAGWDFRAENPTLGIKASIALWK